MVKPLPENAEPSLTVGLLPRSVARVLQGSNESNSRPAMIIETSDTSSQVQNNGAPYDAADNERCRNADSRISKSFRSGD
jgi:hypothetical protein